VSFLVASSPRLSEEAKRELNSLRLQEFAKKGLTINEEIEIDARLLKSASRSVSKEGLRELKEKRVYPAGKVDKSGNTPKFNGRVKSE
jgi:transposase, IS5 family